ncbi:MAG: hypothetical protein HWQ35_32530 [Nostoc sp. NMS1]|uniref:hypothetical protein n=1 Tax=unclassified Nostoc TaxID=2593658 RepID=UPI0025F53735|nr:MULTISPECIES: hypothetical protein [unclassified Nostoc]MBN3911100.1 hypothetical protein [Nostoc sp. NMS1]MBN3990031.1 hypothetical protein [Nostoc sp. NMS2]
MKKIATLAIASAVLTACTPSINSNSFSGSDNYEVEWTGANGSKLFGSYVMGSKNLSTPSKVEKVTATLPYKVSFSAPKNTLISAAGATVHQGTVEIKIFKNGSECGKAAFVGTGAMANKVCQ